MSYAIIRNTKYKRENLKGIYRHNERRNKNYSNKNINKELSYLNYSLKECNHSYEKEFEIIKEKYNLKGQIKVVSNIACEYIITSDKEFFETIGEEEIKRYFETAYKFVSEYKNLGEQYIMSAKVHMDEETPHMHLIISRQASTDERAEKYEKERNDILSDNRKLYDEVENIKQEYEDKAYKLEYKYQNKIHKLEKENKHLNKIIDRFKVTIEKFIHWICKKFNITEEDNLIRDFQKETNTSLDSTKQIIKEDREEEWDLEL